jgi:hypothetical protein
MKKADLTAACNELKQVTHDALQLIWDNTNKGQRKKLLKNEAIAALLARYEINTEEE